MRGFIEELRHRNVFRVLAVRSAPGHHFQTYCGCTHSFTKIPFNSDRQPKSLLLLQSPPKNLQKYQSKTSRVFHIRF